MRFYAQSQMSRRETLRDYRRNMYVGSCSIRHTYTHGYRFTRHIHTHTFTRFLVLDTVKIAFSEYLSERSLIVIVVVVETRFSRARF